MCAKCGCEMQPIYDIKRIIQLWSSHNSHIIIKIPSGIYYSNQTGGICCHHPEIEGVLIPLPSDIEFDAILSDFPDDWSNAWWYGEPENERKIKINKHYDIIESRIREIFTVANTGYEVIINRDDPQEEAWVSLIFKRKEVDPYNYTKPRIAVFEDLKITEFQAILTYPNSD
jgi:hypothetical protein